MSRVPRRTVSELIARYQLEPSMSDVYVEGTFDRDVLSRCSRCSGTGTHHSGLYSIDTVEIPPERLVHHGLTDGNKQRLVSLARDLANAVPAGSYRCIVDRDLDHCFGDLEDTRGLRWTVHCAIELYFFSERRIRDVLEVAAKARVDDWHVFLATFAAILMDLFALRLADRSLGLFLRWIPFGKTIEAQGSRLLFDEMTYSDRLLTSNNRHSQKEAWSREVKAWKERRPQTPSLSIRGHDFVELLAWSARQYGGLRQFADCESVARLLVLLADREDTLADLLH